MSIYWTFHMGSDRHKSVQAAISNMKKLHFSPELHWPRAYLSRAAAGLSVLSHRCRALPSEVCSPQQVPGAQAPFIVYSHLLTTASISSALLETYQHPITTHLRWNWKKHFGFKSKNKSIKEIFVELELYVSVPLIVCTLLHKAIKKFGLDSGDSPSLNL